MTAQACPGPGAAAAATSRGGCGQDCHAHHTAAWEIDPAPPTCRRSRRQRAPPREQARAGNARRWLRDVGRGRRVARARRRAGARAEATLRSGTKTPGLHKANKKRKNQQTIKQRNIINKKQAPGILAEDPWPARPQPPNRLAPEPRRLPGKTEKCV